MRGPFVLLLVGPTLSALVLIKNTHKKTAGANATAVFCINIKFS